MALVLIKGAGDLASGVALRLHRCGFQVVMTEIERPLTVRRSVAFAQAIFDGATHVEEVEARRTTPGGISAELSAQRIPILVDGAANVRVDLQPDILVDAIMAKRNLGTQIDDAPLVIALGPDFIAGVDCHAVIETQRGHNLGRVLWQGSAEPDTGRPGRLPGLPQKLDRVLRAPCPGYVHPHHAIGDRIESGSVIATVATPSGKTAPVNAPFTGVLRGLIHESVTVSQAMKIGDLDPRIDPSYCFTVSDKSMAIAGGVLEAILSANHFLQSQRK